MYYDFSIQGVGGTVSVVKYIMYIGHQGESMGGGLSRSSVASFLLLGGGGEETPKCTDKNIIMYIERAKRASASEIYAFSGLKIHLHIYIYNQCSDMAL